MITNTKFQASRPCGFRQEEFISDKKISGFPYIGLCKTCDLRAGPFVVPGA